MPHSNGDLLNGDIVSNHVRGTKLLDHTRALDILESEYSEKDGLDVETLIDSKQNGGLTYNDFLILPGYIGTFDSLPVHLHKLTYYHRFSRFCRLVRHTYHETNLHKGTISFLTHGHGY
jgi:hypothetical protein